MSNTGKLLISGCLVLSSSVSVSAFAAPLKPAKMTCAEFLALGDAVKPKVLFWAEGFNEAGEPVDAVVDIGETDTLVPVLVTECTKDPKATLATTVAKHKDAPPKVTAAPKPRPAQKPAIMSCAEFVALDDVIRPKVVYWAEGFNKKGKPVDAVFDVTETDTLVPVVIDECKATPKITFWERIKSHF